MPDRVSNLAKQLRTKKNEWNSGMPVVDVALGQQGDMEIMFIKKLQPEFWVGSHVKCFAWGFWGLGVNAKPGGWLCSRTQIA